MAVHGTSRQVSAEFAPVGDDKVFSLINARKNEGPGVGYRGLFYPKVFHRLGLPPISNYARRRLLVTPPIKPPSVGLAASALPRAGAVLVQNWYFSGAAPMLAPCQVPSISASPPDRPAFLPARTGCTRSNTTAIGCALERDGDRVRLITRGGYNWTSRYPWIVEAALKNRVKQFVIDGEAVVLGVDGVADFNALHSRKHDDEVQLYAFDILALDGEDLRAPAVVDAQDQPCPLVGAATGRHLRRSV